MGTLVRLSRIALIATLMLLWGCADPQRFRPQARVIGAKRLASWIDAEMSRTYEDKGNWVTCVDVGDRVKHSGTLAQLLTVLHTIASESPVLPEDIHYSIETRPGPYFESCDYVKLEMTYERTAFEAEIVAARADMVGRQSKADAQEYMQYQYLRQKFGYLK